MAVRRGSGDGVRVLEAAHCRRAGRTGHSDLSAVVVTSSFLPGRGGIESYLSQLCTSLGDAVAVVAPGQRDGHPLPRDLPYETVPGPGAMIWPGPAVVERVVEVARSRGTDRVLFGTPWPLVLIGPALIRAGLRYAVVVHGAELVVPGAIPLVGGRIASALAGAELLLPVSDYTARATARLIDGRGHPMPEMEILRARVDVDHFHPDAPGDALRARIGIDERPAIVCFGRLVRRKGVHRIIQALPEIRRAVPDAVLVVGGTGPEEPHLRALAKGAGEVVFLGRVAADEAPALYAAGDVFVLPVVDRWFGLEIEGLGVVLLEAAACGRACVTGRSGGTPEAVVDGTTGFVVDARDRAELSERVVRLLRDRNLARRMGHEGREHVTKHFSGSHPGALTDWVGRPAGKPGTRS